MKKVILFAGIILLCWADRSVAYAGSLNVYENEVIAAAQGEFESDGIRYKLDSSFLNQLVSYLSSDEVDLTREQRDEVLTTMNDYIDTGVQEGYLIPVEGQDIPKAMADKKDTSDTTDKNSEKTSSTESATEQDNSNAQSTQDATIQAGTTNQGNTLVDEIAEQISVPGTEVVLENGELPTAAVEENLIIKNTGFNFNRTVLVAVGMGMLMMLGIIVTYKFNYFAQSDE